MIGRPEALNKQKFVVQHSRVDARQHFFLQQSCSSVELGLPEHVVLSPKLLLHSLFRSNLSRMNLDKFLLHYLNFVC